MFTKTAAYYDALYHFKDYGQACEKLHTLTIREHPDAMSFLDVACGTGKHIEYLGQWYDCTGIDINPGLLEVARERCPEVPFIAADMITMELGRRFDIVACLFSSIGYVQSFDNLVAAVRRMADHLEPGGLLVIEPWLFPEQYWVGRITSNYTNLPDLKIAWMYLSELGEGVSIFDIHYMVGTKEGVTEFREQHVMGLWTKEQYEAAFLKAGLSKVRYEQDGFFGRGVFYARKPA